MEMSNKRIDGFLIVSSMSEPLNDHQLTDNGTKIRHCKNSALLLIQADKSAPFEQGIITILSGYSSPGTTAKRANPVHDEEMRLEPHVTDGLQSPVVGDADEGEVFNHSVGNQLREFINMREFDPPSSPLIQEFAKWGEAPVSGGAVTAGLTSLSKTAIKTLIGQGGWGRAVPSPTSRRSRNRISIMKLLPGRQWLEWEHGTVLISDNDKQATGRNQATTGRHSGSLRLARTNQFASSFLQANLAGKDRRGYKAEENVVIPDIVSTKLPSAGSCLY